MVCHVRARRLSRDSRVKSVRHENAFQIPREASQLRLSASEVPRPPLPVLDDSQQCRLGSLDNASVRGAVTLARLHVATNLPNTDPRPTRRAIGTPASWIRRASSARFCGKRVPGQGGEPQFQRSAPLLDGVYGVRDLPSRSGEPGSDSNQPGRVPSREIARHLPSRTWRRMASRESAAIARLLRMRLLAACLAALFAQTGLGQSELPNIVVVLADDLGWGDPQSYQPESRIPTPNIDRLAGEGMLFSDAHSPSSVCTPTRYGLLTGRYAWRTSLSSGVLDGFGPPLIEPGQDTMATLLRRSGYRTAAVGKWHLGMRWRTRAVVEFLVALAASVPAKTLTIQPSFAAGLSMSDSTPSSGFRRRSI